jgi:uncharacterized protein YbbC (DUF1343 family)
MWHMSTPVTIGADRLAEVERGWPNGWRIGLLTNASSLNARFESTIELCTRLKRVRLNALFACEHGLRGERQAGVLFEDEYDERLGIPVFSLYGSAGKRPQPHMLDAVDAVLFDIQDVGVRFYTYLSTLQLILETCAEAGKPVVVLDRPNPLRGGEGEGGLLESGFESFVGAARLPIRTGLTIGETAMYVNSLLKKRCMLQVVPMQGWNRNMQYADTGLHWTMPSPNMPTLDTVLSYAGICLFEGTNVSEGRGTTRPFEIVGAPWLDGDRAAAAFNRRGLPGVYAHPHYFTPSFSKHQGELCGGVRLYVTDTAVYRPVRVGLHLLDMIQKQHPDQFEWLPPYREGGRPFIDLLTGSDLLRTTLAEEDGLERILGVWDMHEATWRRLRRSFELYA